MENPTRSDFFIAIGDHSFHVCSCF